MKVLVFKTASNKVVDQLLDELVQIDNVSIHGFIQQSMMEQYEKKYSVVKWIDSGVDIFSEEAPGVKNIKNTYYDEIYIPCSSQKFTNFENIFFLLEHLSYEKVILYDCMGKRKVVKKQNKWKELLKYLENCLIVSYFTFIYKIKSEIERLKYTV